MELNMKHLDYSVVMSELKQADQEFTGKYGCGAPHQEWDAALEKSIILFNSLNNTNFDPEEARHQYIEQQEAYLDSPLGKQVIADLVDETTG